MKMLESSTIDIKCEITKGALTVHKARVTETYDVSNLLKEFVEEKLQTKLIEQVEEEVADTRLRVLVMNRIKEKLKPYCRHTYLIPKAMEIAGGQIFQIGCAEAVRLFN